MNRRSFIQRILLQLLVLAFGPRFLELLDVDAFDRLVDDIDTDPFGISGLSSIDEIYKKLYPDNLYLAPYFGVERQCAPP